MAIPTNPSLNEEWTNDATVSGQKYRLNIPGITY